MEFKFIHSADMHLDSPLKGLERYEGAPVEQLRSATRRALENLVDFALAENVNLVLIAGDIYDVDWKDYNTGQFFHGQLARLSNENIPVVMIRGNHDAKNLITKAVRLPQLVTDLPTNKADTVVFEDLGVAVHGRGYQRREETEDLAATYPDSIAGLFNIGMLHTALTGRPLHGNYAPCSEQSLINKGYHYWALGHVHNREQVHQDPWIIFPGNLQGRNIRETGTKGASLVSVQDGRVTQVRHQAFDVVRWQQCCIDLSEIKTQDEAIDVAITELQTQAEQIGHRLLAARIVLHGQTQIHDKLMQGNERWIHDLRAAVIENTQRVWLEKILFQTQAVVDVDSMLKRDDAIGALLREIRQLQDNPKKMKVFLKNFSSLAKKLPKEYAELPEYLDLSSTETLSILAKDVERYLLPKLQQETEML